MKDGEMTILNESILSNFTYYLNKKTKKKKKKNLFLIQRKMEKNIIVINFKTLFLNNH